MAPFTLLADPGSVSAALDDLDDLNPVGVDVERADADRYFRQAAVVQVGGQGRAALIDPLALGDLSALDRFLRERTVVLHAMENDLVPLAAAGVHPTAVQDTAIAAALLGLPTGLASLLETELGIDSDGQKEAMQRADWQARPLSADLLAYAAADVAHLPRLWSTLADQLAARGRRAWYDEELAAVRTQPPAEARRDPRKVKGIGRLRGAELGRAYALWHTRERLARDTDTAPGRIAGDRVLIDLATDPPASVGELGRRGVRRQAVRRFGEELLAALASAEPADPPPRPRRVTDADRAAVDTLRGLRADVAAALAIDPGVLCPSRVLLRAVLADPASPHELRAAMELRDWQWEALAEPFCSALDLA